MSWAHVLTTSGFWTGALVSGVLTSGITYFSARASDRRKAKHEREMQTLKDERDDKLRGQESLYIAAQEFAQVATDILTDSIDIKGTFNVLRDALFNRTGQDDPMAKEKFEHSEKVVEAQKRIAVPMNKLKLVAPPSVLDAAQKVITALGATAKATTNPIAAQVARKAAGEELANFTNIFRVEVSKERWTDEAQRNAALSFLDMLAKQTDDFVEESRDAMRAAGFGKTPWDNWERKTPRTP